MKTTKPQYWVIDTDSTGDLPGEHSAKGPYPSLGKARAALVADVKNMFEGACPCLQQNNGTPWTDKPVHIVKVVQSVIPAVRAQIKLEDVGE